MDDEQKAARTRELARQIWEAEGRPDGHSARHWHMAERLVAAEVEAAQYDQESSR
ncbi:DUF2934 domain-containing protein [Stenotrophomonas sp. VV52]|uniref:DUF2934 domain-containing protein n=1 Tax=Stenotrophomonas sp. VV52 TaxID=2066958 RepID=UPI000C9E6CD7|nr:DUF2934 domain-containing protein [Stenotrophomonas sp. VV52]